MENSQFKGKTRTKTITYEDLTGQKFGHLTVLKLDNIKARTRYWLCECDCELHNKKVVKERYLTTGETQSCGCIKNKNNKPFMGSDAILTSSNQKLYFVWNNMKHRCYNKDNKKYKEYGALGVTICDDWKSFQTFELWSITNGYKEGLALIRKNKRGNYEPNNCVWDLKVNYHKIQKEYEDSLKQDEGNQTITESNIVAIQNYIKVDNNDIIIKEYEGKRVITFDDIDKVHQRPEGTARRNFNSNKKHFQEGIDYFNFKGNKGREALMQADYTKFVKLPKSQNFSYYILTESGYSMLVKSFTDDLAWQVQRKLVDCYFTVKQLKENPETADIPVVQNIQSIDILETIVKTFKDQQSKIDSQQGEITELKNKYISLENKLQRMVQVVNE